MHRQEDIQQHIRDLERQLAESAYAKADGTDVQQAWYYLKTFPYLSVYLALEKTRPLFEEFTQSYPSSKEPYSYFVEQYQRFRANAAEYEQLEDRISAGEYELRQKKEKMKVLAGQVSRLNFQISLLREEYDEHSDWGTIDRECLEIHQLRKLHIMRASLQSQIYHTEEMLRKEKTDLSFCLRERNLFNKYQPLYDCLHNHFRQLDPLIDLKHKDDIEHADCYWRYSSFFQEEEVLAYQRHYQLIKETQDTLNGHLESAKHALEAFEKAAEKTNELTFPSTVCDAPSVLYHLTPEEEEAAVIDEMGLESPVSDPDISPPVSPLVQIWIDQKNEGASKRREGFLDAGKLRHCAFLPSARGGAVTQPMPVR